MTPANDPSSQFLVGALQLSSTQGIIHAGRAEVLKLHKRVEDHLDEVEAIIRNSKHVVFILGDTAAVGLQASTGMITKSGKSVSCQKMQSAARSQNLEERPTSHGRG